MDRFEHLSMVAFLILGLGIVRFMTSWGALLARNIISHDLEEEEKQIKMKSKSDLVEIKLTSLKKKSRTKTSCTCKFLLGAQFITYYDFFHNDHLLVERLSFE